MPNGVGLRVCAFFILLLQEPCMFKPRTTLIALFVLLAFVCHARPNQAPDYSRRRVADETRRSAGAKPRRQMGGFFGDRTCLRRERPVIDLWIAPGDGSAKPRRLTATRGAESGAVWSPDSRRIAFSARREGDEVNQIYVIDIVDGGEAARVTSISTGARSPQWRPGRQSDSVREQRLSGRDRRRSEQEDRRRTKGAEVSRASL